MHQTHLRQGTPGLAHHLLDASWADKRDPQRCNPLPDAERSDLPETPRCSPPVSVPSGCASAPARSPRSAVLRRHWSAGGSQDAKGAAGFAGWLPSWVAALAGVAGWRAGRPACRLAWLGLAWPGLAWLGLAWPGLAWLGLAWPGLAWLAWPGLAWLAWIAWSPAW